MMTTFATLSLAVSVATLVMLVLAFVRLGCIFGIVRADAQYRLDRDAARSIRFSSKSQTLSPEEMAAKIQHRSAS